MDDKIMIVMKKSELDSLLQTAVSNGIRQCIDEGVVIGVTPRYNKKVKTVRESKKYYTANELCKLWSISPSTLWAYEKRGIIQGIRREGTRKVLFDKKTIDSMDSPRYIHSDSPIDNIPNNEYTFGVDSDFS